MLFSHRIKDENGLVFRSHRRIRNVPISSRLLLRYCWRTWLIGYEKLGKIAFTSSRGC